MEHKGNRKAQHEKSKEEYCASFLPRQQVVPREGGKTAERGGGEMGTVGKEVQRPEGGGKSACGAGWGEEMGEKL